MVVLKTKQGNRFVFDNPGLIEIEILETQKNTATLGVKANGEFAFCHAEALESNSPPENETQPRRIPIEADDWGEQPVKIGHSIQ